MSKNLCGKISKILASAILLATSGVNLMPNAGNTVFAMDDTDDEKLSPAADLFTIEDKKLKRKKKIELEGYPSDDDGDIDEIKKKLQPKIKKKDKAVKFELIEIEIKTDEELKKEHMEKLKQEYEKKEKAIDGRNLEAMREKMDEKEKRTLEQKKKKEKLAREQAAREAQEAREKQEREEREQAAREREQAAREAQEAREKQEQAESRRRKWKIVGGVGAGLVVTIGGAWYIISWNNVGNAVDVDEYDFDFEEDDNSQDKIHYLNN